MADPGNRVFLASRNAKKIEEMRRILDAQLPGIEVCGLDDVAPYDEPVEDQPTFEGNALLKARAGLDATGLPSLADDSGLCVEALNQMPGVLSARWSGLPRDDDRNNTLLLDQLADVPDRRRGAEFRCAVAFCHPDGAQKVTTGVMPGRVIRERRGEGGFGYDVLFVPEEQEGELTSAELSAEAKDAISHRGQSLRAIAPVVVALLTDAGAERIPRVPKGGLEPPRPRAQVPKTCVSAIPPLRPAPASLGVRGQSRPRSRRSLATWPVALTLYFAKET